MFNYALDAEKVHAELYNLALQAAMEGKDLDTNDIYLCPICGHIEIGKPENNCPICGTLASKYVQV
jgi:rubrerythrin